jgi:hypothetical protein
MDSNGGIKTKNILTGLITKVGNEQSSRNEDVSID